jgi:EmrB/QacA subfamily drug resistance transporter
MPAATPESTSAPETFDPQRAQRVLALVSVGFFLTALDFTVVNVAFRHIEDSFGPSAKTLLPWTLSGYSIAFAAGLLTAGRMADTFGRKRTFLAGNLVFTTASLVCGLAPNVELLIAGRVVQALGGAMIVPAAIALVVPEYPVEQRAHVFGITAAMGSIAAATGPVVGGVLTSQLHWRWVFLINLPICLITVVLGKRLLDESRDPEATRRPDLFGAALAISSVALLTLAIVEGESWGWTSVRELVVLAVTASTGIGFIFWCRDRTEPVLDLRLFRLRFVSAANAANLLWSMSFYSMYFTNVTWLQEVWGYSPQRSGLAYVAGPVVASIVSIKAGQALKRRSSVQVVVGGTVLFGAAAVAFNLVASEVRNYWGYFLPMIVVIGAAVGAVIPVLSGAANAYLPANRFAMGSALYTTGRQVGAALGIAIVSAIQLAAPGQTGLHRSYWYVTGVVLLAGAVMVVSYRQPTESELAASVAA